MAWGVPAVTTAQIRLPPGPGRLSRAGLFNSPAGGLPVSQSFVQTRQAVLVCSYNLRRLEGLAAGPLRPVQGLRE